MKNKKKLLALSMSALMFFSSVPQNFSLAYAVTEQKTETVSVKFRNKRITVVGGFDTGRCKQNQCCR